MKPDYNGKDMNVNSMNNQEGHTFSPQGICYGKEFRNDFQSEDVSKQFRLYDRFKAGGKIYSNKHVVYT